MKKLLILTLIILLLPFILGDSEGPNSPSSGVNIEIVGTIDWGGPGNILLSDNVYAVFNPVTLDDESAGLRASVFGFNIPTGATINGIVVEIERFATGEDFIRDASIKLVVDGNTVGVDKNANAVWPIDEAYVSYGSSTDLWAARLSAEDINDNNEGGFGVQLRAADIGGGDADGRVDHIRITVYYTPSAGDTTKPLYIVNSPQKNNTKVFPNMLVNFTSNWTDNVAVNSFIFELNQSGSFRNSTALTFGTAGNTGNVTSNITLINASTYFNVSWRFWVNDTSNNWNNTGLNSFIVDNNIFPIWNNSFVNQSIIYQNTLVNFSIILTDDVNLSNATLSLNLSGNFFNSSFYDIVSTTFKNISNVTRIQANQNANVTWFWAFYDAHNNFNTTQWQSFTVADNTTPLFNNSFRNETNVYENTLINFSSIFTDNIRLNTIVFSINLTGNFVNSSYYTTTNTFLNLSNITRIVSSQGNNVTYFFWFNDSSGNNNYTQWTSFIIADNSTPTYFNLTRNTSLVINNLLVNFSVNLLDNVNLNTAVFSINQNGSFLNSSYYVITSPKSINISNLTRINVLDGQDTNVTYFFWFNDSSGNSNYTEWSSFTVDRLSPNISFLDPINNSLFFTNGSEYYTLFINITNSSASDYVILFNSTSNITYTSPFNLTLHYNSENFINLEAYINDSSNNFNKTIVTFKIRQFVVNPGGGGGGIIIPYTNLTNLTQVNITIIETPKINITDILIHPLQNVLTNKYGRDITSIIGALFLIPIVSLFLYIKRERTKRGINKALKDKKVREKIRKKHDNSK